MHPAVRPHRCCCATLLHDPASFSFPEPPACCTTQGCVRWPSAAQIACGWRCCRCCFGVGKATAHSQRHLNPQLPPPPMNVVVGRVPGLGTPRAVFATATPALPTRGAAARRPTAAPADTPVNRQGPRRSRSGAAAGVGHVHPRPRTVGVALATHPAHAHASSTPPTPTPLTPCTHARRHTPQLQPGRVHRHGAHYRSGCPAPPPHPVCV